MKKIAILGLVVAAGAAHATILWSDTFESYAANSTLGANGYSTFGGDSFKVSTVRAQAGTKSVARDLTVAGTYAWHDTPYDSSTDPNKVVVGSVYQYIESGTTLGVDECTVGLEGYNFNVDAIGWARVDTSAGELLVVGAQGNGFYTGPNVALDAWHKLDVVMDFDGMVARARVNGVYHGSGISMDMPDLNDVDLRVARYDAAVTTHRFYQDNYKVESMTPTAAGLTKLSGTVTLNSYLPTPDAWFHHIGVVNPVTNTLVDDTFVLCDTAGNWKSNTVVPNGTYDIYIKTGTWLSKKIATVTVNGTAISGLNAAMNNGDVNMDDLVDIADYTDLALAFDAVSDMDGDPFTDDPSPNWNANADLDGSGNVDIADYTILALSFDGVGDAGAIGIDL